MSLTRWLFPRKVQLPRCARVFCDGAIRQGLGYSGLAFVVLDEHNQYYQWWSKRIELLTCNEAEYEAAIFALQTLTRYAVQEIMVFTDSQILVHQMRGLAAVNAPALRSRHAALYALKREFERVSFYHVPREQNRLADALANLAAEGSQVPAFDRRTGYLH